ncbi:MAG: hypothetical protein SFY56_14955 [Bacteroidota bacterium]|nr:hypothetical protein [Bacteroidota bacterium]
MEPIKGIKDELLRLLEEAEEEYLNWYTSRSTYSKWLWHILLILAILPGFITGVIAAYGEKSIFNRDWLVWLPIGGSFAGTLLTQFKIYDVWKIREDGRIAFEGFINLIRGRISLVNTPDELGKIYFDLQQGINDIETDALQKFFILSSSEFVAKFQKVTP